MQTIGKLDHRIGTITPPQQNLQVPQSQGVTHLSPFNQSTVSSPNETKLEDSSQSGGQCDLDRLIATSDESLQQALLSLQNLSLEDSTPPHQPFEVKASMPAESIQNSSVSPSQHSSVSPIQNQQNANEQSGAHHKMLAAEVKAFQTAQQSQKANQNQDNCNSQSRQEFANQTSQLILERLTAEASDVNEALSLFQSYMSQMLDEYDRRRLAPQQVQTDNACQKLAKHNTILKKAVLIYHERFKDQSNELQKAKLESTTKDQQIRALQASLLKQQQINASQKILAQQQTSQYFQQNSLSNRDVSKSGVDQLPSLSQLMQDQNQIDSEGLMQAKMQQQQQPDGGLSDDIF